jgi:hypothetical protein
MVDKVDTIGGANRLITAQPATKQIEKQHHQNHDQRNDHHPVMGDKTY